MLSAEDRKYIMFQFIVKGRALNFFVISFMLKAEDLISIRESMFQVYVNKQSFLFLLQNLCF